MNNLTQPESIVLWSILLLPVFLSLVLYLYVHFLTSRWYKGEDEEDEELASTNPASPPSYLASYQDRLFPLLLDHEKPPDYPAPPSYASTTTKDDDEEMTLDQVKHHVLQQKRQRSLLPPYYPPLDPNTA